MRFPAILSLCAAFLLLTCVFPAFPHADPLQDPRAGFRPEDARHAIPNNPAPPLRTTPLHRLPPLPPSEEGTIRRVHTNEKVVALTFDLCELETVTTGYDAPIFDFLRERHIPATLFMGGKWMRTHSRRVRELMADPLFTLGNHAWSHGNFGIMDEQAMKEQFFWTQAQYELLREAALTEGQANHLPEAMALFRLPYGRCSEAALHFLAGQGVRVIQWSNVPETTGTNTAALGSQAAASIHPGAIILLHANRVPKGTAELLRALVGNLQKKGYRFVSVPDLLALGTPETTRNGYFNVPGDNLGLDRAYGINGTGRRHKNQ